MAGPTVVLALAVALTGCSGGHRAPARRPGVTAAASAALRAGLTRTGGPAYYLSLGDSLAVGLQPGRRGRDSPTASGYPDQLLPRLRTILPAIQLVKLGCSGETTSTMLHGGNCRYPAGSQLKQAASFLRAHRGRVALITIDIGANDPNSCVLGARPSTIPGCLYRRVPRTERNLSTILHRLRSVAGPQLLIIGMTYYVPELSLWRSGQHGKEIAMLTDDFAAGVNKLLTARYHRAGARVANVFGAFRSTDFGGALRRGLSGKGTPPNVRLVCSLTWMCARPPRGPNEHANDAGYGVIARSFWRAIIAG